MGTRGLLQYKISVLNPSETQILPNPVRSKQSFESSNRFANLHIDITVLLCARDLYLDLYDRSEIKQAHQQHCCREAYQTSKRCDKSNYQSRGFETSRDLMIRRLHWKQKVVKLTTLWWQCCQFDDHLFSVLGYWNGALQAAWCRHVIMRHGILYFIW